MALVHLNDGRLPEDRVTLYSRCIDILLGQWELRGKEETVYGSLMSYIGLPDRDVQRLRPLLTRAAFTAHTASDAYSPGSLGRATLRMMAEDHLATLGHTNPYNSAQKFLEYTDIRAGLIQASEIVFRFGVKEFRPQGAVGLTTNAVRNALDVGRSTDTGAVQLLSVGNALPHKSKTRVNLNTIPELWDDERYGAARPNYPVVGVSWYEAAAFCRWLSQHPVYNPGGATPEGVDDMAGNVWEWTRSAYVPYPYDPADGRETLDEPANKHFTLRGGSWNNHPLGLRASNRSGGAPDIPGRGVGFRLARQLRSDE
jgi:Sulfatase-modifying factor enzyme 1